MYKLQLKTDENDLISDCDLIDGEGIVISPQRYKNYIGKYFEAIQGKTSHAILILKNVEYNHSQDEASILINFICNSPYVYNKSFIFGNIIAFEKRIR